jgi:spermidine synthase
MNRLCLLPLALMLLIPAVQSRVLHSEKSLYQNVLVVERQREICLQFTVKRDLRNQTCMNLDHPDEMLFSYTRMMMAALLLREDPESILVVGLGGGTLPMALQQLFPEANLDIVEIDAAVVRVAEKYFHFKPSANTTVYTMDARVFGRRMNKQGQRYDLILLDAYNGEYIPEHLMTAEYLSETKALLTETGVLAANTFAISTLYDHESTTYEKVFGPFLNFRLPESANRVVLAMRAPFPPREFFVARASKLALRMRRYGVDIESYLPRIDGRKDWDPTARVLTDQYSPANLLNH